MAWEIKISQIHRGEDYELQLSVPIDHDKRGDALINQYGEVIGITSAGLGEISTANLNFAVDIERVRDISSNTISPPHKSFCPDNQPIQALLVLPCF